MYDYDKSIRKRSDRYYSENGIVLGRDLLGKPTLIPDEDISGHLLITGKTGTGKSNLVSNICRELDFRNANIVLIDPHGTLSDSVIDSLTAKKLIFISPKSVQKGDSNYAISFNTINGQTDDETSIEATTGWIRDLFANESSFSQGSWGPRLELIFKTLLKEMLIIKKDANLSDFMKVLIDHGEMKSFLSEIENEEVKKFVQLQMKDWRGWIEYTTSSINKLLPVLSNSALRRLLSGSADSFDMLSELRNLESLIVVEVSKGLLSEDVSRMVSVLFLLKIWNTVVTSFSKDHKEIPTYIIIDESQNIPSGILQKMLSEGRKYGIKLILSSQFLDQTDKKYTNAILGNIRNYVSFNVSDSDARLLSSTIVSGNDQRNMMSILKTQRLHNAILWSQTYEGLNGPVSVIPYYYSRQIDEHNVDSLKQESVLKYGTLIETKTSIPQKKIDLHEQIITKFRNFLLRKNIEMESGKRIGDVVPDGFFTIDGTEIIVEVEVSDLEHKYRIMNKIRNYGNRKMIFITDAGKSKELYDLLIQPNNFMEKENIVMEIPTYYQNDRIYMRDLSSHLSRIFVLEDSDSGFKLFNGSKTKRFLLNDLRKNSSFIQSIEKLETYRFRLYLYELMIQSEIFYIELNKINDISIFSETVKKRYFEEIELNGEKYITLSDVLKHR